MSTWYRTVDHGRPVLWGTAAQPPARWHGAGDGPVSYFADTPYGAWAEFLRHEEITDPADLAGIQRDLWAVEIPDATVADASMSRLPIRVLTGGPESYAACQAAARRARERGAPGVVARTAALADGDASGWTLAGDAQGPAPRRAGRVLALFGVSDGVHGWPACVPGRPDPRLLPRVRPLA